MYIFISCKHKHRATLQTNERTNKQTWWCRNGFL